MSYLVSGTASPSVSNEWYTFDRVINKDTCKKIINLAQDEAWGLLAKARIGQFSYWEDAVVLKNEKELEEDGKSPSLFLSHVDGKKKNYKPNHKERISEVFWTSEQWVYDLIWPFMMRANEEAGWRYIIEAGAECQLTRYREGSFFNFHRDGFGDHLSVYDTPNNEFINGRVRKLSMSVILNDDFEGGNFEFASYNKEKCIITPIKAKRGDVIVFPSAMEHRVTPITKGMRYSLVVWFVGPPFK